MCARMYAEKEYIYSGLMTGTMWDMMMKFISTNNDYSDLKNTPWGNYSDTTLKNIHGQYIIVNKNNKSTNQAKNGSSENTNRCGILSTAASDDTRKKNIYDLAGNLWEWTQEACWREDSIGSYTVRGGSFWDESKGNHVCYRGIARDEVTQINYGFRPALFIK